MSLQFRVIFPGKKCIFPVKAVALNGCPFCLCMVANLLLAGRNKKLTLFHINIYIYFSCVIQGIIIGPKNYFYLNKLILKSCIFFCVGSRWGIKWGCGLCCLPRTTCLLAWEASQGYKVSRGVHWKKNSGIFYGNP